MGGVQSWCGSGPVPRKVETFAKIIADEESTSSVSDIPHRALYQTGSACLTDEKVCGRGTFGIVSRSVERSAIDASKRRNVAVKRSAKDKEHDSLRNERAILATIDHPYIVKLYGFVPTPGGPVWQLMEDCPDGELFSLIAAEGALPDATAAIYYRQILGALNHLHVVMRIVHRDLKPENILLTHGRKVVKLCDFGTATKLSSSRGSKASGRIGSLSYAAPEIYQSSQADFASDMWSAGVLLYVMCCAASPFRSSEDKDPEREAVERVKRADMNKKRDKWKKIKNGPKRIILSLLQVDAGRRLTASQVLSDPWLNESGKVGNLTANDTVDALRRFAEIENEDLKRAWRALGSQLPDWNKAREAFELLDADLDGVVGFNDLSLTDYPVTELRACFTYSEIVAALLAALSSGERRALVADTLPFAYEAFGGAGTDTEFVQYENIIMCSSPIN